MDPSLRGQKLVEEQDLKQGSEKESSSKTSVLPMEPKTSERSEEITQNAEVSNDDDFNKELLKIMLILFNFGKKILT